MPTQKVKFTNRNGYQLAAMIDLPLRPGPYPFALFAHVFTGNKSLSSARYISKALTLNGIAVMRFDFTGLGESEGKFEETNFTSNVEDLKAASRYLEEYYQAPSLIIGHSLGGAAALFAGSEIETIKAIATIGAPSYPEHVTHLIMDSIEEIEKTGCARVMIGERQFIIKKQFLDDLRGQNNIETIKHLDKALMVMHSPQDTVVGIDNAAHIYHLAKHPKSFVTLDGADHMLSNKEDALYAGQIISSWVKRYITMPERSPLSTDEQTVARLSMDDKYTTDVLMDRHSILGDEPTELGGNDFGPSPYDLLTASLATCTAMTLQMYARRKNWDLQEVKVHVSHAKTTHHKEDMADIHNINSKIDQFTLALEMSGDLDINQKLRLVEIADKCPIHRTLASPQVFRTELLARSTNSENP